MAEKVLKGLITVVGLAFCAYQMLYTQYQVQSVIGHLNTHLGFALLISLLFTLAGSKTRLSRALSLATVLVALAGILYVQLSSERLELAGWYGTTFDYVIGGFLILTVLETTRRSFGWFIPALCLLFALYPFVGAYLPEPLHTTSLALGETIANLSVALTGGIYGIALYSSADFIFLFVLFGGLLSATGATDFFMQAGKLLGSKVRGGPAVVAVMSSAMVGSVTGSTAANIAITGAFTIPAMKKAGYAPAQAGAIEAAASNGGQIMPPIMGIVAFGMAGITGIPYVRIISMAVIPALLYFLCCGLYVYFSAGKLKLEKFEEKVDKRELFASLPHFIIPFVVILGLLIAGYSVMMTAFWAIITVVVSSFFRKNRPSLLKIVKGFVEGAKAGAEISVMSSALGLIITTLTQSGLGIKLSAGLEVWSGGNLFIALWLIWIVCVIMGMAGPSLTAYIVVSMFAAPALMKIGVPMESAHFFVMFAAVFAFLTPPVALGSLVAARLAGTSYVQTAMESCKVASAAFLLPFACVYVPAMLLQPQEPSAAVLGLLACVAMIVVSQIGFTGYYFTNCNRFERAAMIGCAVLCFLSLLTHSTVLVVIPLIVLIVESFWQRQKHNRAVPASS